MRPDASAERSSKLSSRIWRLGTNLGGEGAWGSDPEISRCAPYGRAEIEPRSGRDRAEGALEPIAQIPRVVPFADERVDVASIHLVLVRVLVHHRIRPLGPAAAAHCGRDLRGAVPRSRRDRAEIAPRSRRDRTSVTRYSNGGALSESSFSILLPIRLLR